MLVQWWLSHWDQLDTDKGTLSIDATGNTGAATYSLVMDRITATGEEIFGHEGIALQPKGTAYLDYGRWKGNGQPLQLQIDHNSGGTIDETVQLDRPAVGWLFRTDAVSPGRNCIGSEPSKGR